MPAITREETASLRARWNLARYGEEAATSPLFWVLEKLHANDGETYQCLAEKNIRGFENAADYIGDLTEKWRQERIADELSTDLESLPPSLFFDWVTIAIRRRDVAFFEETLKFVRDSLEPFEEDVMGRNVLVAYQELKEPGMLPTKKAVREKAIYNWARWNAIMKRPKPWDGEMPPESEVEQEMKRPPKPDWTRVFNRYGLGHLPNAAGGRPRKSR